MLHSGVSDYVLLEATINIPVGAMTNDQYCTSIQLSSDGDIEPQEETFTLSLAPLPGTFNPVNLSSTMKTVTIIDGDSEFTYFKSYLAAFLFQNILLKAVL